MAKSNDLNRHPLRQGPSVNEVSNRWSLVGVKIWSKQFMDAPSPVAYFGMHRGRFIGGVPPAAVAMPLGYFPDRIWGSY